jgi:hypothetical protein
MIMNCRRYMENRDWRPNGHLTGMTENPFEFEF